jgi:hypothetical protein
MSMATNTLTPMSKQRVELARVPGQFDRLDQSLVVATPTCCCCCCCLVTTFSTLAYSSAMLTAETRKQNDPVNRRFWFGFAGFFCPIVASSLSSLLFGLLRIGSRGLIASTVVYVAIFTALMVFLTGKASQNTRPPKDAAKECVLFCLVAGVCFAGELFSVGFLIFGQLAALFVPYLIGNSRGFRGVDKAVSMAHRRSGTSTMNPIPATSGVYNRNPTNTATQTPTSTPSVWTSIEEVPSSPSSPSSSSNPFPAFPNYPPSNDTPPSTDS